jgi:hypothetical protein
MQYTQDINKANMTIYIDPSNSNVSAIATAQKSQVSFIIQA